MSTPPIMIHSTPEQMKCCAREVAPTGSGAVADSAVPTLVTGNIAEAQLAEAKGTVPERLIRALEPAERINIQRSRGPFHLTSIYYKHGQFDTITIQKEEELRVYITEQTCELRGESFRKRLAEAPLDDVLAFFLKYGQNTVREQEGWGCIAITEGGTGFKGLEKTTLPLEPNSEEEEINAVEYEVQAQWVAEQEKVSEGTLTPEEIYPIKSQLEAVENALAHRDHDFDFAGHEAQLREVLELPASTMLKKRVQQVLAKIGSSPLTAEQVAEVEADYQTYRQEVETALATGDKAYAFWRARNLVSALLDRQSPLRLRFKLEALYGKTT